jgi:outer membrane protein OmpA-like peptidoglycan-associated protein
MSMKLIIPGLNGSGDGHWQNHWLQDDPDAVLVEQRDWHRPNLHEWTERVEKALARHPGSILIAHSIGAIVVAGLGLQAAMRQALDTLGTYDVYGLLFDFDSARLRPETAQLVREIAVMLQQNPNWTILIAGHTDSTGGADHNMRLSEQRAASVKQALVSNGVAAGRLQTVGHGMSKPKADNSTLAGRAINRRVEFRRLDR